VTSGAPRSVTGVSGDFRASESTRLRYRYGAHNFERVLVLAIAIFAFAIAAPDEEWAHAVLTLLACATLVVAVWTSGASARTVRWAALVSGVGLLATVLSLLSDQDTSTAASGIVGATLVAVAPVVIVKALLRAESVTVQTVLGVLSVYVLIGLLFANLYAVVGAIDDGPFFAGTDAKNIADYVYFGFVTQATVGYGDFVAANQVGRALAVLQAVLGQIYLVTVVAVVVTNLARQRELAADE
jgi:hypothetical protein